MTDDQIIQLLKEIDMCTHTYDNGMHIITTYDITKMRRFAERIATAEREACARACEKMADNIYSNSHEDSQPMPHAVAKFCADAIRARGEQEQPR